MVEDIKQTTLYFKQEGIKEQKELLNFWTDMIIIGVDATIDKYKTKNRKAILINEGINENKSQEIDILMVLRKVIPDTYIYSSKKTTNYLAQYMQYTYKKDKGKKDKSVPIHDDFFLVAKILVN